MAADRPIWYLKLDDAIYKFDPEELLGVKELRQIKQWFGPELGAYLTFQSKFTQGDPDAACCAAWLVRKAAGESGVPDPPNYPSFSLGSFFDKFEPTGHVFVGDELKEVQEVETVEKDPTNTSQKATSVSTETPTDSEQKT